jgi:integrin beta 3
VKEFTFHVPTVIDRGVYRADESYQRGDGVTWAGSFWIAQKDTSAKPDAPDGGWRLAVKRGRDGKDGKDGAPGEQGKEGPRGRDLTQMGLDGTKW